MRSVRDRQWVLVLAGTLSEADQWRRDEGLDTKEVTFVRSGRDAEGTRPTRVVALPGFGRVGGIVRREIDYATERAVFHSREPIEVEWL